MRPSPGILLTTIATLTLAACAARPVAPVSMTQPGDNKLGCQQIADQIGGNRAAMMAFRQQDQQARDGNVAKVAIGSIVPVAGLAALAAVDLSNEEQIKERSMGDRNDRLLLLAHTKGCSDT
jgi:hypothetical protein